MRAKLRYLWPNAFYIPHKSVVKINGTAAACKYRLSNALHIQAERRLRGVRMCHVPATTVAEHSKMLLE